MKRIILSLFFVLLLPALAQAALPGFMLERMGTMSGQILVEGQPVTNGIVALFHQSKGLPPIQSGIGMPRIPEFLGRIDAMSKFALRIAAGKYYMGILLRDPAEGPGPPRPGEKYYFAVDDKGGLRLIEIANKQTLDLGQVNSAPPESFASLVSTPADSFTVQGRVVHDTGGAYSGAIVLAKRRLNTPRPDFISNRTLDDGIFTLKLPAGEQFYLIARETIAGARPLPGQKVGTYGIESQTGMASPIIFGTGGPPPGVMDENQSAGDKALTVTGAKDQIVGGITINMYGVPDPNAIKNALQGTPGSPKFETGAALNNIFFEFASHRLDPRSYAELDRWLAFLAGMGGVTVEISGHTDDQGSAGYNQILSQNRAQAVADYLIGKGIAADRISVKGFGEDRPVADNSIEEGRAKNRRVEIRFNQN